MWGKYFAKNILIEKYIKMWIGILWLRVSGAMSTYIGFIILFFVLMEEDVCLNNK